MSTLLTYEQLKKAHGKKTARPVDVVAWLENIGVKYTIDFNNRPITTTSAIDVAMGIKEGRAVELEPRQEIEIP